MGSRIIVPFLASLALCAPSALAQDAPSPPDTGPIAHGRWQMNKENMAKYLAEICSDRYARAVGSMAYLEIKLALTDKQKPLFERWKDAVLSSTNTRSAACVAMKWPDEQSSIVEHLKLAEKMLQNRLDGLKAQMPSLEALVASLTDQQQQVLERVYREKMFAHAKEMTGNRMFIFHHDDGHAPPTP